MLKRICCGGQSGADFAGWRAALITGLETYGVMPKGFKTEDGPKSEYVKYGATEHKSSDYGPRTYENIKNSDDS